MKLIWIGELSMKLCNIELKEKLSSERILLRKLIKDDQQVIFDIYSHEESAIYDDWDPMKSIKEAEILIANAESSFNNKEEIRYGIVDKDSNELVGSCGIFEMEFYKNKFWDGIVMGMLKKDYDKISIK